MDEQLGGPYLAVAAFCENVIEDKQGTLSLIRLVDRMTLTVTGPEAPEKMPPFPLKTNMVLAFKSGFARGSHRVRVRPINPDGRPMPEVTLPMQLEGDDRGANLLVPVQMTIEDEGLYWFEVFVGDSLVTRMPFRIIYQRVSIR